MKLILLFAMSADVYFVSWEATECQHVIIGKRYSKFTI